MKIVHVDHGLMPFDLYDYQEEMVDTIHNNRFVILRSNSLNVVFTLSFSMAMKGNSLIPLMFCDID